MKANQKIATEFIDKLYITAENWILSIILTAENYHNFDVNFNNVERRYFQNVVFCKSFLQLEYDKFSNLGCFWYFQFSVLWRKNIHLENILNGILNQGKSGSRKYLQSVDNVVRVHELPSDE